MDWAIFSSDGLQFIFRWIHFLAGVAWIGLLYYFNFVHGAYMKEAEDTAKSSAVRKLLPRALWWFRWGAVFTFLSGLTILAHKGHSAGFEIFSTSWGIFILVGGALGTIMFLNVWLIIWPNQKIVIASAEQVTSGKPANPHAPIAAGKALLASRTNALFSIPMLFFMGAASHLPLMVAYEFQAKALIIALATIIGLIEINAIKGKTGPMTTVNGVITCGFILTAVLYGLIEFLT